MSKIWSAAGFCIGTSVAFLNACGNGRLDDVDAYKRWSITVFGIRHDCAEGCSVDSLREDSENDTADKGSGVGGSNARGRTGSVEWSTAPMTASASVDAKSYGLLHAG